MIVGAGLTESEVNGVHSAADWSHLINARRAPESLAGNNFEGSTAQDLDLLASLGITEMMVTLEWAKLQPTPGDYDLLQVELYRHLLSEIRERGIKPWACLIDGTMPGWFSIDEGGFGVTRSRNLVWPRHVEWMAETFHDHVEGWVAQREPVRRALRSHLLGIAPPAKRAPAEAGKAIGFALLAESEAWRVLQGSQPVALFHTLQSFHSERDNVPAVPEAAWLHSLMNNTVAHALTDGVIDVDDGPRHEAEIFRDAYDRLIFQARPPIQVDGDGRWSLLKAPLIDAHAEMIDNGVALAGEREWIIAGDQSIMATTEFGWQASLDEDARAQGLGELLKHVQSLRTGAEKKAHGWWQMSPIDGWHWEHGFGVKPGIVTQDRKLRPAAEILGAFS